MGVSPSTTLVVVGDDARGLIDEAGRFANVRAATFPLTAGGEVQRWINRSKAPYVVHDHDPLGHVAAAWVEFFDDLATLGTLDLEVDRALEKFERAELSMPDYYVVADPESLPPTWRHWWLGVLPQAAPTRVIPWDATGSESLARLLRTLPTSRQWPDPGPWLRRVARTVPDLAGLGEHPLPAPDPEPEPD